MPRVASVAPVLVAIIVAGTRAHAQVAGQTPMRCGESPSGVSSLLASTAGTLIGVGPAGRFWRTEAGSRIEALAAGRQCVEDDLHDAARDLLQPRLRDVRNGAPADPLASWSDAPRQGVFVRARAYSRVALNGAHALAYDAGVGAWRSFDHVSLSTYVQEVETPFSRARRGASAQKQVTAGCDTGCVFGGAQSGSGSTASASALANWHARELVVAATGSFGSISLAASAGSGISTLEGRRRWVMGEVAAPLAGRMDLVLLGRSASRFGGIDGSHLGAMLRYHIGRVSRSSQPAPTALAPFRAERGRRAHSYRLILQSGRASSVRLRADFTSWEIVALAHERDDAWVIELDADPGMHQVLVSIDGGAWQAPAGLPTAPDGFGEAVGVLQLGMD